MYYKYKKNSAYQLHLIFNILCALSGLIHILHGMQLIFALVMPLSTLPVRPRKDPLKTPSSMQPTPQQFSSYQYEIPDGKESLMYILGNLECLTNMDMIVSYFLFHCYKKRLHCGCEGRA